MTEVAQPQEPTAPPAEANPPAPPADQSVPPEDSPPAGRQPQTSAYAALRAEQSTIGRQRKAATDALGLDKTATPEEIQAAIEALKRPRGVDPEVELPAEIVAEQNRLAQRAWQSAQRDFGEEFTMQAQGLQELVYNTDDPYELTAALHELAQSVNTSETPPADTSQPPAQQQQAAQPRQQDRPGVDMETGQPGWKVQADEDDKVGSGDTRGFFAKVFPGR